jgi:hypothetical protein
MKKSVAFVLVIIIAVVGMAVWWTKTTIKTPPTSVAPAQPTTLSTPIPADSGPKASKVPAPSTAVAQPKSAPEEETPPAPLPLQTMPYERARYIGDLEKVMLMLRDYRTLMKENPVGSNAEITKALMGGNPKHAQLGPTNGEGVNDKGELVDRWGTPYFFHQMSATVMEIRSAGPDKVLWTTDDITVK